MLSVRPKVAELAFHVFSRPLHPELISVHGTRHVTRDAYQARAEITNCGHVITFTAREIDEDSSSGDQAYDETLPGGHLAGLSAVSDANHPDHPSAHGDLPKTATPATLCEVATSAHQPLPSKRCLIHQSLQGSRTESVRCRNGVQYRTHFQLESVDPKLFWMVGQQLGHDSTEGLLHVFESSGRMALGAVSYVHLEARRRSLLVQAIHTFPDDYAIVKVESLFSLPDATAS
ncbi:MAG: DUF2617 domain-containing protein [Planctomycetota bacterium]